MKYAINIILSLFFCSFSTFSQDWVLPFSSRIEKDGKKLQGAVVTLLQGSKQIQQTMTGEDGAFKFDIPPSGDFIIVITKQGHCTKKFQVSTKGVPPDRNKDNFKNEFKIEAISLFEPLPGIDYSVLNQPLVKVNYNVEEDKFDYDEQYINQMLDALDRLKALEKDALNKRKELEANYQNAIKTADKAFSKKDWTTAKASYLQASQLKPTENYPKDQLTQIEIIIKDQEALNKKASDEAAAKAKADKEAADKLAAEKANADAKSKADAEASKKKAEADALAKKAADEAAAKAKADKEAADRLAAEKAKRTIPQALGANKYNAAILKADGFFKTKRYQEAQKFYEDALVEKAGDAYAKGRLTEIEKLLKADTATIADIDSKKKTLRAKYPPGVTEEIISGTGVVIVQRVVIKDEDAFVYQKKIFSWGGISYFRDATAITESTFEQETKP